MSGVHLTFFFLFLILILFLIQHFPRNDKVVSVIRRGPTTRAASGTGGPHPRRLSLQLSAASAIYCLALVSYLTLGRPSLDLNGFRSSFSSNNSKSKFNITFPKCLIKLPAVKASRFN
jgi:hypothetical protein